MKHLLIILFCFAATTVSAQNANKDDFQSALDACITMSKAAADNDSAALRQSARELKASNVSEFSSLRLKGENEGSMDGHLVFDEDFADSLAQGKDVYRRSGEFLRTRSSRGQSASGIVRTKTCFVKAKGTTRYTFSSKGHQDLAVVAEAGGLVTMKIHATNKAGFDKRFDDTKNVKKGMPHRRASFDLPNDMYNTVHLDIVNCSKKDISYVIISRQNNL